MPPPSPTPSDAPSSTMSTMSIDNISHPSLISDILHLLSHPLVPPFLLTPPPNHPTNPSLITPLPCLTPHPNPNLVLLPVTTAPPLTLGFAVSEKMTTDSYATVIKHSTKQLLLLVGRCAHNHVEILVCNLSDQSLSVCRFHCNRFKDALESPSEAAFEASLLSHTPCNRPIVEKNDCRAKLMRCFNGVGKLPIFKRSDLNPTYCRSIASWFINVARRNNFVCPISLLMASLQQNDHPTLVNKTTPSRGMAVWQLLSGGSAGAVTEPIPAEPVTAERTTTDPIIEPVTQCTATLAPPTYLQRPPQQRPPQHPLPSLKHSVAPLHLHPLSALSRPILPFPDPPPRRLLRLAPAPPKVDPRKPQPVLSEDEERRRKAELRKARNRESAQRSNFKRKMKLQALKDELEKVCLKEKNLRERERHLRQENINLRSTVSRWPLPKAIQFTLISLLTMTDMPSHYIPQRLCVFPCYFAFVYRSAKILARFAKLHH